MTRYIIISAASAKKIIDSLPARVADEEINYRRRTLPHIYASMRVWPIEE